MCIRDRKGIVGIKSNSIAILVDAVNNLADGGSSVITIIGCLLYTSDAADDTPCVDLGGRRIIKKKKKFFFFFFFFFFFLFFFYFFFFSSRRRHTRSSTVSWARRCV